MTKTADPDAPEPTSRGRLRRGLWLAAGAASLATGIVGIFLPLLPTTPLVILAAFCFSRGSRAWESWLLGHPRFGPMVRSWRAHRVVPSRVKVLAVLGMTGGCTWAAFAMPPAIAWLPAAICLPVAIWLVRLPSRAPLAE